MRPVEKRRYSLLRPASPMTSLFTRKPFLNQIFAAIAVASIVVSLWHLQAAHEQVAIKSVNIGSIPATVYRPASGETTPVVVIAHGFAGSQQLMQSFALSFARNGYTAVTFDFAGHGRNPVPLTGSITEADGATRVLMQEAAMVAEFARSLGDGRLALLGHSMASDIVVRVAMTSPDVSATIAVSMFSPTVTSAAPRNLLVIAGDWEGTLKQEALRAVSLPISPTLAQAGVTYGDVSQGTGRRAAFSPHVEHASVLYSQHSMHEAVSWLDQTFGKVRTAPLVLDGRGPWILLLLAGTVLLGRQLSPLLPIVADPPAGASFPWRRLSVPFLVPMVVAPMLLRVLPTHFLPTLVGDYLAAHFAMYGAITALCIVLTSRRTRRLPMPALNIGRLGLAALAVISYGFVALVWPVNAFITSFVPGPERIILVLAMLVGTLVYFLSDEWMTRGLNAPRGAYAASKLAFLVSLAIAVGLDFERLFFLVIIVPAIVAFFLVYGTISSWTYRQTGHPFVAGFANAVAFAWAIGVTFPLIAG